MSTLTIEEFQEGIKGGVIKGLLCERCGQKHVGPIAFCSICGGNSLAMVELGSTGRVITYTIQFVAPEPFANDVPYAWLVVELDDGPRVTGWMPFISRPEELQLGERVRFVRSYRPGLIFEKVKE